MSSKNAALPKVSKEIAYVTRREERLLASFDGKNDMDLAESVRLASIYARAIVGELLKGKKREEIDPNLFEQFGARRTMVSARISEKGLAENTLNFMRQALLEMAQQINFLMPEEERITGEFVVPSDHADRAQKTI